MAVPVLSSCNRDETPESTAYVDDVEDSVRIDFAVPSGNGRHLDLLIYSATGLRALEAHCCGTFGNDTVSMTLTSGDKTAVAIIDSPNPLNIKALQKYETMEQLTFNASEEDFSRPAMSGTAEFSATEGATVTVAVTPLLCSIVLAEITNNLGGYTRLEDPCIFLTGCNPSAEALRSCGFRPQEQSADTLRVPLPFDIGVFTQYPETVLHCYPNDTPEYTLGTPSTEIWLECGIKGRKVRFREPLPPFGRGSVTRVSVTVENADCAKWKIL